ncbi:MAG: acyltransferase [Chloroflexota bacterium]
MSKYEFDDFIALLRARYYFLRAERGGPRIRAWGRLYVNQYGRLVIGDRCRFVGYMGGLELGCGGEGLLEIGENTFINYGTSIFASDLIRIGKDCHIGTYCMLMDNDFHGIEPEKRNEMPPSDPIVLEDNVWLGGRVIVLKGVTIGEGSVIAAGSIVTKDIPPRSLAVGSPARIVREL